MRGDNGTAEENERLSQQQATETQQTDDGYLDESTHLEKMGDYKSYAKGLMDIALISANANQLRTALEYPVPYSTILASMIAVSILLQVIATLLLVIERMTCKKHDYVRCHKYNLAIAILVCFVIFINIFITAFGVPGNNPKSFNSSL
ncbi:ninjurin-2-like [Eurytemora carolleeae]|uniref:ninjurin-2-like n=1 Tax=Eurytemora carolleeae TaxID=1294199 RepID=UPI000C7857DF|nr:ninjurin-2-like [Eurytemora carolleeae]|eukprot:XP_023320830.1 ninjurin-2-like [Eurytemora affinis]